MYYCSLGFVVESRVRSTILQHLSNQRWSPAPGYESGVPIALDKIHFDTSHHGQQGGDNFGEGSLDVRQISSCGLNATTLVSNTNTNSSRMSNLQSQSQSQSEISNLKAIPIRDYV